MPTSGRSTETDWTGDDVFIDIIREFCRADQRCSKMHGSGRKAVHHRKTSFAKTFSPDRKLLATTGKAWESLVAEGGRVEVVFTDHRMLDRLTGTQFVAKVAQHYPEIPVVVTCVFYDRLNGLTSATRRDGAVHQHDAIGKSYDHSHPQTKLPVPALIVASGNGSVIGHK